MSRIQLRKGPRREVKIYIFNVYSFHHHRRFWPPFDTWQWIVLRVSIRYTRCRPTHPISVQWWARVEAHCWFNAGRLCAKPTRLQHWPNTWFFYTSIYSNHWTANQCCFNVDPACLTMAQQQPSILYAVCFTIGVPTVLYICYHFQKYKNH